MFSRRLPSLEESNALTRLAGELRARGVEVLDLTESNPTRAGFAYGDFEASAPVSSVYDPHPFGMLSAREAVSRYYAEAHGVHVSPERIALTASTSEAYSFLFKLLCDPGDEVLVPQPSYPLFEHLAALDAVRVVPYSLRYHEGWWLDAASLRAAISERTRAVIVVNPNNPTGSYLKGWEFELLQSTGLPIISDEVFSDYVLDGVEGTVRTVAGRDESLTFSLSGLSKVCALPQMKLGWIAVSGPEAIVAETCRGLEFIADTFLSVGAPVQLSAPRLLENRHSLQAQIRDRTRSNLEYARQVLAQAPCRLLAVEGGWYLTIDVPRVRSEEQWCLELLEHEHVLVQPGYFFDFPSEAFLIVSLLTPEEIFREGLQRMIRALRM